MVVSAFVIMSVIAALVGVVFRCYPSGPRDGAPVPLPASRWNIPARAPNRH
jgi:hypothetical protein